MTHTFASRAGAPATLGWATFDDARLRRFVLGRYWGTGRGRVVFCGLNPSRASAREYDWTARRFEVFARRWGYEAFVAVNAYALIATDPRELLRELRAGYSPDSAEEKCLTAELSTANMVVCCWGAHCTEARAGELLRLFEAAGVTTSAFGLTKQGAPRHPRGLSSDVLPVAFP